MTLIPNKLIQQEEEKVSSMEQSQEAVHSIRCNNNINYSEENGIVLDKWLYEVCGEQGMLFPSHRRAQYEPYLHKMRNVETNKEFTLYKTANSKLHEIKTNNTDNDANFDKLSDKNNNDSSRGEKYTFAYPSRSGTREVLTLQNTMTELHKEENFLNEWQVKIKEEIAKLKRVIEQKGEEKKKSGINLTKNNRPQISNKKIIKFNDEFAGEEKELELKEEHQEQHQEIESGKEAKSEEQLQTEENEENYKEQQKEKEMIEECHLLEQKRQEYEKKEHREQYQKERQEMEMEIASITHQVAQLRDKRGKLLLVHQQLLEQQLQVNRELNALKDTQRILQSKDDEIQKAQEEFNAMKLKVLQEEQQQEEQQMNNNNNKNAHVEKNECKEFSANTENQEKENIAEKQEENEESDVIDNDDNNISAIECEKQTNTLEEMQLKIAQLHKALSAENDTQIELRRTLLREEQIHSGRFRVSRQRLSEWQEMSNGLQLTCDQLHGQVHVLEVIVNATNERLRNVSEASYVDRLVRMNELFITRSGEKLYSWWYGSSKARKPAIGGNEHVEEGKQVVNNELEEEEEQQSNRAHVQSEFSSQNNDNTINNRTLESSPPSVNNVNRVLAFDDHDIAVHSLIQPPPPSQALSSIVSLNSTPIRQITHHNNNNSSSIIKTSSSLASSPMCSTTTTTTTLHEHHNDTLPQNVIAQTPVQQTHRSNVSVSESQSLPQSTHHNTSVLSSSSSLSLEQSSPPVSSWVRRINTNTSSSASASSSSPAHWTPSHIHNKEISKREEHHNKHHRSRYDLISHLERWCDELEKERVTLITLAGLIPSHVVEQKEANNYNYNYNNNNNNNTSHSKSSKYNKTSKSVHDESDKKEHWNVYGPNILPPATGATMQERLAEMQQNLQKLKELLLHEPTDKSNISEAENT